MTYPLRVVTPEGERFCGPAVSLTVPAVGGRVEILARHVNFVTALGAGPARVVTEEGERNARCAGGMLAVTDGAVTVAAARFEWIP